MSVVAVKVNKNSIKIASDSIITRGNYIQEKRQDAKLAEVNDMVIAHSGLARDFFLLTAYAKSRQPEEATEIAIVDFISEFIEWAKNKDKSADVGGSNFIIIYEGKVFSFMDFYVREIVDYVAIGAGLEYATAVLYMGGSPEKAVETACELSLYCEAPVNKLTIKR